MPKLLADSSALLAYALDDDKNHRAAVSFVQEHPHARFVVTELIVAELATRTRAIAGAEQAGRVVRSLLDSRRHELIFVDLELLRAGGCREGYGRRVRPARLRRLLASVSRARRRSAPSPRTLREDAPGRTRPRLDGSCRRPERTPGARCCRRGVSASSSFGQP